MGLLLVDEVAVLACGSFFCKVAKSDCAAERFPADRSFPNCWISCCTCCFWLCALPDSSKSKRLLLEIPETDIKNLPFSRGGTTWQNRSAPTSQTLVSPCSSILDDSLSRMTAKTAAIWPLVQ